MSDHHDGDTSHGWALDNLDAELFRTDVEHFKWVWNETEGELVWRVSGPGDGFPAHEEQVRHAWGREPSQASGDVLGTATYVPAEGGEPARVTIYVYYGGSVPSGVVGWFCDAFPEAELHGAHNRER